jgi:hypothetical protein
LWQSQLDQYEGWADERVRRMGYDSALCCQPELRRHLEPLGIVPESLVTPQGLGALQIPEALVDSVVERTLAAHLWRSVNVLAYGAGNARRFGMALDRMRARRRSSDGNMLDSLRLATNFFEKPRPTVYVVEPLPVFQQIAELMPSRFTVRSQLLENAGLTAPCFDAILGCAPLVGDWEINDAQAPSELRRRHLQSRAPDYTVCKLVSLLVSGGVAALFVPRWVLDREDLGVREWLSERVEWLGVMWRLPTDLWEYQGSSAVVDLIVVRKR